MTDKDHASKTHYFSDSPQARGEVQPFDAVANNITLTLESAGGIFSRGKLDKGSKLMIENIDIPSSTSVLDLGCGFGPVGIFIKKMNPSIELTMIDVNPFATSLAKKNAKRHNIECTTKTLDATNGLPNSYDTILLNPPQSAGKQVCLQLFQASIKALHKKGQFIFVARHNKGGSTLSNHLVEICKETWNEDKEIEVLARGGGFRVYRITY